MAGAEALAERAAARVWALDDGAVRRPGTDPLRDELFGGDATTHPATAGELRRKAATALSATLIGLVIALLLSYVLRAPRVTHNTVLAAVCIYVLLGVLWGFIYLMIYHIKIDHDTAVIQSLGVHLDCFVILQYSNWVV